MSGNYFSIRRCSELSVVDHITTQINASWSGIAVVKSFLASYTQTIPCICVRMLNTESFRKEIGGDSLRQRYTFIIDIFARSDGQRIDLAEFVVQAIKGGCVYYNYSHSSSSKETLDKVADGRLILISFDSDSKVDFGSEAAEHDKFRHSITFTME